jgi:hypothetical protein
VGAAPLVKALLEGTVSGALFTGTFTGKVSGKHTTGPILVQVTHGDAPLKIVS